MIASSAPVTRVSQISWLGPSRHRLKLAIVMGVPISVVAILLIGFSDIVPVEVSGYATAPGNCIYCPAGVIGFEQLPAGIKADTHWVDVSGGTVLFSILSPAQTPVCQENGSSGTCSFASAGGVYSFHASNPSSVQPTQQVNYTVTYYKSVF